jgi:hypothetical protein
LTRQEYHVFNQVSGKAPFDLVAYKDSKLFRISVKGTQTTNKPKTSYIVQLRSIRHNRTGNTIYLYDKNSCDILAVYVEPLDRVYLFDSQEITTINAMTIKV